MEEENGLMLSERDLYGSDNPTMLLSSRCRALPVPGATMTCTVAEPAEPVTLETVAAALDALTEQLPPNPPPLFDPDRVRIIDPNAEMVELTLTLPESRYLAWGAR